MPDPFIRLSADDQREVLRVAADQSGRPAHLLEKDVWVVWALDTLFAAPVGEALVFKGGTSLSKAYNAIRRFSEDVDLTYSIRALAPDLVDEHGEVLPETRSAERRWTAEIRRRLPVWVNAKVIPVVATAIETAGLAAQVRSDGDRLFIDYEPLTAGSGYVAPSVMLEFGARSTGEPASKRHVVCDAASVVESVAFPTAQPRVMLAERTFWEKATAIHVYCLQERLRGDRFSRHWHDISRLNRIGIAARAMADRALAEQVARHKAVFFAEKASDRSQIDYLAAVTGALQLVPTGAGRDALAADYANMVADGLLLDEAESFDKLMEQCFQIQEQANAGP